MKRVKSILLASVFALSMFTGCASNNNTNDGANTSNNNVNNSANENTNNEETEDASTDEKEEIVVQVTSPDGAPSIAIAKLIKENPEIKENYNVNYTIEKSSDALSTSVMKETPDIAVVPSNMASIAYNKTGNYQIAGTVGFGSFYIVSTKEMASYEDLKGRTIVAMGKDLTPDITAQSVLSDRGIDSKADIEFSYVNSPNEIVPMIVADKADTAIIPEPALTGLMTKREDVKIFKSLNDEYKELNNSEYGYPQSTIIVKKSFYEENKEFVDEFLSIVEEGINWGKENKEDLGTYCEEIGISTAKPVIIKSMDRLNLNYAPIEDTKEEYVNYFQKLFDFNPTSIGGTMPDEGIFIER